METQSPVVNMEEDVFEVERIIKKRRHPSKGIMYYVKWRNFPSSANTWEPACNFSEKLIEIYETSTRQKQRKLSNGARSRVSNETSSLSDSTEIDDSQPSCSSPVASSCSSSSTVILSEPMEINRSQQKRAKLNPVQMRQKQIEIQKHIERQQQMHIHTDKKQLSVFNPVGCHTSLPVVKEVVYEAKLTKEPIIVTDVTAKDFTVTISECKSAEGFFSA